MSDIHLEMRVWRKHLRESRQKRCDDCQCGKKLCVSCHRNMKPNADSDSVIQQNLCSECQMMEDGW